MDGQSGPTPQIEQVRARFRVVVNRYLTDRVTYGDLLAEFGSVEDEPIQEILDLLVHEPARDGLLGVGQAAHDQYMAEIQTLCEQLTQANP